MLVCHITDHVIDCFLYHDEFDEILNVQNLPRMSAITFRSVTLPWSATVSSFPTTFLLGTTVDDTTAWGIWRRTSKLLRQESKLWACAPPMILFLFWPSSLAAIPTSEIGPHWIESCEGIFKLKRWKKVFKLFLYDNWVVGRYLIKVCMFVNFSASRSNLSTIRG